MWPIRQSRRAEIDIEKIFDGSLNTGAEAATEAYLACLLRSIGLLPHFPELGIQVGENPLLRCLSHREHAVYYEIEPDGIKIVRVLEARHVEQHAVDEEIPG